LLPVFHWLLLATALCACGARAVLQMSGGYDFTWYHLPAALRVLGYDNYTPEPWIAAWLDGYPPLAHAAQALMILVTGRFAGAAAANLLAFAVVTGGLWWLFRERLALRWWLTAALAIPAVNLQLGRGFVDLFAAVWVVLAFGAVVALYDPGLHRRRSAHVLFVVGVTAAALSKPTTWPLLVPLAAFYLHVNLPPRKESVLWLALAALGIGLWPLRNLAVHGNPTHPIVTPVTSSSIAAHDPEAKPARVAPQLLALPRPLQFWYSAFELSRLEPTDEPLKWSLEASARGMEKSPHFRLGGFFFVTFLALLAAAISAGATRAMSRAPLLCAASLFAVVMPLQAGYELRYWLALPLSLALIFALAMPKWSKHLQIAFGVVFIGAFSFVCDRTKTLRGIEATDQLTEAPPAAKAFWRDHAPGTGEAFTITGQQPATIFFTGPTFREYRIIEADSRPHDTFGR